MIGYLFELEQRIREAFLRDAFPEYDPRTRRVARALQSLPSYHRAVFCLMRYEGQSIAQIAMRFGVSERRVEMTMGCTIKMLGRSIRRQERKGW